MVTLSSPKQPPAEHLKDWYPYYAGFTSAFVSDVFECYLQSAGSVVDPWNGSGTTTAVAAGRNVTSMGIDVNPALSVVARARLTPKSITDSLVPIAADIAAAAERSTPTSRESDPLSAWLGPAATNEIRRLQRAIVPIAADIAAAAERSTPTSRESDPLSAWLGPAATNEIRRLQRAIHVVTAADDALEVDLYLGDETAPSRLPLITAFFYSVLFAATRDLLRPFRGSNPTWMVAPSSPHKRLRPGAKTIRGRFLERTVYLSSRLQVSRPNSNELTSIRTGRASVIMSDEHSFDACLTSPPYATRIDYIRGSTPELSVLGLSESAIANLRRQTTGTPIVRGVNSVEGKISDEARNLIKRVAGHDSHGSANYYAPWLRNYLIQIHETLELIAARVKPAGRIAIVVQDSYYKALHIDLQHLVTTSLATTGRSLIAQHDFPVHRSMSNMNSRARSHLQMRSHRESLLVFE